MPTFRSLLQKNYLKRRYFTRPHVLISCKTNNSACDVTLSWQNTYCRWYYVTSVKLEFSSGIYILLSLHTIRTDNISVSPQLCRSQWLRSLWRASAAARLLGLRVRKSAGAHISVSCECAWIFAVHFWYQRNFNLYGNSISRHGSGSCTLHFSNKISKCVTYLSRTFTKHATYFTSFWHFPWRNCFLRTFENQSKTRNTEKMFNWKNNNSLFNHWRS